MRNRLKLSVFCRLCLALGHMALFCDMTGCVGRTGISEGKPSTSGPVAETEKTKNAAAIKEAHGNIGNALKNTLQVQQTLTAADLEQELDKLFKNKGAFIEKKYQDSKASKEYNRLKTAYANITSVLAPSGVPELKKKIKAGEMALKYKDEPEGAAIVKRFTQLREDESQLMSELSEAYTDLFPAGTANLKNGYVLKYFPEREDKFQLYKGDVFMIYLKGITAIDAIERLTEGLDIRGNFGDNVRESETSLKLVKSEIQKLYDNRPRLQAFLNFPPQAQEKNLKDLKEIEEAEAAYLKLWE